MPVSLHIARSSSKRSSSSEWLRDSPGSGYQAAMQSIMRELSLLGDRVASACDHAQRHRGVTADDAVAVLISVASDIIDERRVDDRGRRLRLAV
jgi:hypothetical protein